MPPINASQFARVARKPGGLAAFLDELVDRLGEARRRHGSAACIATAPSSPCKRAGRAGPSPASRVARRTREDLRCGRRRSPFPAALEALAAAATSASKRISRASIGERRERAHRVDDQPLPMARAHLGDRRQRVEDAGAGLAVDEPTWVTPGRRRERLSSSPGDTGASSAHQDRRQRRPIMVDRFGQALAVRAVVEHEDWPSFGTIVATAASTAKVPLPCIGTTTCGSLAVDDRQ